MRKFPLIRQYDLMQCGAACLTMLCCYYGDEKSLCEVEPLCTPGKRGVSMQRVKEGAESLRFNTRAIRCTVEQLGTKLLPCIIFWESSHFVVLYKIKSNKYYIADPAKGMKVYKEESFLSGWTGTPMNGKGLVLLLKPAMDFERLKSKADKKNLGILLNVISKIIEITWQS